MLVENTENLMKIYDPITEFDECCKAVQEYLDTTRSDPYTTDEIKELMSPNIPVTKEPI